jgi:hypothetical protein
VCVLWLWLSLPASAAGGPTVVCASPGVGCDIVGLQLAIDTARDGDALLLRDGRYAEDVFIARSITIEGESDGAVIVGDGTRDAVLHVESGDVTIEALQIGSVVGPDHRRVRSDGGALQLTGVRIEGGLVHEDPGGAAVLANGGSVRLDGCDVVGGLSFVDGGAFSVQAGASMTVEDGVVEGVAGLSGAVGAVYGDGSLTVRRVGLIRVYNDTWSVGGLFHVVEGTLVLEEMRFEPLESYVGSLASLEGGRLEIRSSTVVGGVATLGGGHVWADGSDVTLVDSSFSEGLSHAGGGSIAIINAVSTTIDGCEFEANEAFDDGGALFYTAFTRDIGLSIVDTEFRRNVATTGGGAHIAGGGTITVRNSTFARNLSTWAGGGGLSAIGGTQLDVIAEQNVFCDNHVSGGLGGGAVLSSLGSHIVTNNVFAGNSADYGGGMEVETGTADVAFNTFVGNSAWVDGGAFKIGPEAWANTDHGLYVDNLSPESVLTAYGGMDSDWNGFWANGYSDASWYGPNDLILRENPGFFAWNPVDPCAADLRVGPDSNVVDAGNPASPEADGSRPDLGAFGGPGIDHRSDSDGDGTADVYDCEPEDGTRYPGAEELCNGLDDDCDGVVDEGGVAFPDNDGDGFGDSDHPGRAGCDIADGWVGNALDCADDDPDRHPGMDEACNGVDDNCDGDVDEGAGGTVAWWVDADGDGWGGGEPGLACALPDGAVSQGGDCDDSRDDRFPGAQEWCDLDHDCDGVVDDPESEDAVLRLPDGDGDGFGVAGTEVRTCDPSFGTDADGDCDDRDGEANPGAPERWYDGVDQDCDGASDFDADRDGFDAWDHGGSDCDDADPKTVPTEGAPTCDVLEETLWAGGGGGCSTAPSGPLPALWLALLGLTRRRS